MATANKFQNFVFDFTTGVMNPNSDTFKLLLTNTLPVATQHFYPSNFVGELPSGNGYVTGGLPLTGTALTYATGIMSFSVNPVTLTATGGSVGPWRYFVYYDVTTGTLMVWYDYGQSTTLLTGQSVPFSVVGNVLFTDA